MAVNSQQVFVANGIENMVSVVDIAKRQVESTTLPFSDPWEMAITPDGSLALTII